MPSLKAFATDPRFDVVGVITRPDAPTGRGRKLTPSPVKATALELGLPVIDLKPRSPEFMEALNDLHADIAAVIAYGNILPKNVLDAVPMGWYNLHFSNLPKWRGAAPVQRAIWAGDPTTGADVFKVGEGLDDGPIVASLTIELTGRETSGELLDRLAEEGAPMYVDALAAGREPGIRAQDHGEGRPHQLDGRGRGHRPSGSRLHATSWGMDRTVCGGANRR